MESNIINLADRRKKPVEKPSSQDLVSFCIDEILSHWGKFARDNHLNDYFIQSVPSWTQPSVNYLEDLSSIAGIELKIGLEPQVSAPGFVGDNQPGWVSSFKLNGLVVLTPFMASEQYARCFGVLLFLKLKREYTSHGLPLM